MGLVLVLLLAVTGVVYGNWSQALTINGTVQMADMEASWWSDIPLKSCGDNDDLTNDVGNTFRSIVDPDAADKGDKVIITTTNAYPGYAANCVIKIKNNGKLPVRLADVTFQPVGKDKPGDLTTCNLTFQTLGTKGQVSGALWTCDQLTIEMDNGDPKINIGETDTVEISLRVLDSAQPKDNYQFQLDFCVEPAIGSIGSSQCATKQ